MSIANEISRIQEARDTLREKAVALGVGLSTDNLTQLATKYDGIVDRGTPNAEVKEGESFTLGAGYYHGGSIKGVAGGGNYNLQSKTVTPTKSEQVVDNDAGYYGLDTVTVAPIPDIYQDVSSVTATVNDVLSPKVYVDSNGKVQTGTMQNRGAVNATLDTDTTSYSVPVGYHNGGGSVGIVLEEKSATPTESTQNITPTTGKVLNKVTVNPIPAIYGDATNADAAAANILAGKKAVVKVNNSATLVTGSMANNGAISGSIDGMTTTSYTVPAGYTSGGTVSLTNDIEMALAAI